MKLSMDLVVEAYLLFAELSVLQPYDSPLCFMAFNLWKGLYEELARREGVAIKEIPMPAVCHQGALMFIPSWYGGG